MKRRSIFLCAAALVGNLVLPVALADDEDVIAYRQHVMKSLNEQSAALGQILATSIPDDQIVQHIETIALTASTALKAFEPKVPGGEAKPDVWKNWPDFEQRMKEFAQKTNEVAAVAKKEGKDAAVERLFDALTCKGCHEDYREEKK